MSDLITVIENMKYQRVKTSFYRTNDSQLLVQANAILLRVSNAAVFAVPDPTLADLKALIRDYETALHLSMGGSVYQRELKRISKKQLADALQQMAHYVNKVCDGNLTLLYQSGFPVFTGRKKGSSPDTPGLPSLKDGRVSGEVCLSFAPVGRDMLYEYCVGTSPDDGKKGIVWAEVQYTTRSFKNYIKGFSAGQHIHFKVRARNKHGVSDWTDVVKWMVR